jgi:hypothetical protein
MLPFDTTATLIVTLEPSGCKLAAEAFVVIPMVAIIPRVVAAAPSLVVERRPRRLVGTVIVIVCVSPPHFLFSELLRTRVPARQRHVIVGKAQPVIPHTRRSSPRTAHCQKGCVNMCGGIQLLSLFSLARSLSTLRDRRQRATRLSLCPVLWDWATNTTCPSRVFLGGAARTGYVGCPVGDRPIFSQ